MSAFDQLNRIAIQYRDQVEECKNFIAWMYLTLNGTNKDLKTRPTLSCDPTLALRAIDCVGKILEQQDINTESKQKIKLMKDNYTIKEIKEAKVELEENLSQLIGDFEQKYGIKIKFVEWDKTIYFGKNDMVRAKVNLNFEI